MALDKAMIDRIKLQLRVRLPPLKNAQNISGATGRIFGDAGMCWGKVEDGAYGDVSKCRGDLGGKWGELTYLEGDVSKVTGNATGVIGNVSNVQGPLTRIWGFIGDNRGIISGNLSGCISRFVGDLTGIEGDADEIMEVLLSLPNSLY